MNSYKNQPSNLMVEGGQSKKKKRKDKQTIINMNNDEY